MKNYQDYLKVNHHNNNLKLQEQSLNIKHQINNQLLNLFLKLIWIMIHQTILMMKKENSNSKGMKKKLKPPTTKQEFMKILKIRNLRSLQNK